MHSRLNTTENHTILLLLRRGPTPTTNTAIAKSPIINSVTTATTSHSTGKMKQKTFKTTLSTQFHNYPGSHSSPGAVRAANDVFAHFTLVNSFSFRIRECILFCRYTCAVQSVVLTIDNLVGMWLVGNFSMPLLRAITMKRLVNILKSRTNAAF